MHFVLSDFKWNIPILLLLCIYASLGHYKSRSGHRINTHNHFVMGAYAAFDERSLTHWSRVTHICVSRLAIIGSDNGLSPGRRQAIIWTNAGILLIGPLGTNFSEIYIEILTFSFKKMCLKVSSAKWRQFCLGLNVLTLIIKSFGISNWCLYVDSHILLPNDAIWRIDRDRHRFRQWLVARRHQAITWTNVDLSLVKCREIPPRAISQLHPGDICTRTPTLTNTQKLSYFVCYKLVSYIING